MDENGYSWMSDYTSQDPAYDTSGMDQLVQSYYTPGDTSGLESELMQQFYGLDPSEYSPEQSLFQEMGGLKGIGNLVLGGLGLYGQYQGQQDRMDLANKQLGMSDEQFAKNLELQREELALRRELGLGNLGISQGQLDLQNNQFALGQGIDEMASKALGMQLLVNRGRMSPEQVNPWLNFMHTGRSQMFGQNSPISNAFKTNPFEGFTLGTAVSHAGPGRLLNGIQSGNPDVKQQFGSGDRRTDTGLKFMASGGIYSSAVERAPTNRAKGNQPPSAPQVRASFQGLQRQMQPGMMPNVPAPAVPNALPAMQQQRTMQPTLPVQQPTQQIMQTQAQMTNQLRGQPTLPGIPQGIQQGAAMPRVAPPTRQRAQLGPDVMAMLQEQRFGGGAAQNPMMQGQRFAKGGAPRGGLGMMGSHQGLVLGETGGQEDAVNARIADGEYIFDADTVSALGDGNTIAGAKKLDAMREEIRRHKRSAPASKIPPKAKNAKSYMKGGA